MRPSGPTSPHPIPGSRSFSCSPISSRRWSDWRSSPHGGDAGSCLDPARHSPRHCEVAEVHEQDPEDRRQRMTPTSEPIGRPRDVAGRPRSLSHSVDEKVVAVEAGAAAADLHQPRPLRIRGRVDRDRSRRHELRGRQESVAGHGCHDLAGLEPQRRCQRRYSGAVRNNGRSDAPSLSVIICGEVGGRYLQWQGRDSTCRTDGPAQLDLGVFVHVSKERRGSGTTSPR